MNRSASFRYASSSAGVAAVASATGSPIGRRILTRARDLEQALERMVGDDWGWQHVEAGEENAPSHVRASLMSPQVLVPVENGELALGTWQGIFFCEFDGPRDRKVLV